MKKTILVKCVQNNKNSGSLRVPLPLDWCKGLGLTKNDYLKFTYDKDSIIITKIEVD